MVLAQGLMPRTPSGTAALFKVCSKYRVNNFPDNCMSYWNAAKIPLLKDRFGDTARPST